MNFVPPYQGKQTVVSAGGGFPAGYMQVNTYLGSQLGWLISTVKSSEVEAEKKAQIKTLARMIANYKVVCTNTKLRAHASAERLKIKLTRK